VTGLQAGEFVHTFGDAHLYLNHIEQARLQLPARRARWPVLRLNPAVKDIFGFRYEDSRSKATSRTRISKPRWRCERGRAAPCRHRSRCRRRRQRRDRPRQCLAVPAEAPTSSASKALTIGKPVLMGRKTFRPRQPRGPHQHRGQPGCGIAAAGVPLRGRRSRFRSRCARGGRVAARRGRDRCAAAPHFFAANATCRRRLGRAAVHLAYGRRLRNFPAKCVSRHGASRRAAASGRPDKCGISSEKCRRRRAQRSRPRRAATSHRGRTESEIEIAGRNGTRRRNPASRLTRCWCGPAAACRMDRKSCGPSAPACRW